MKTGSLNMSLWTGLGILLAALSCTGADTKVNPYDTIAERNPFHLKDPPPLPDPNEAPKGPPPVIPTVEVTGIFNMFHKKQVFLEIVPAPGKPVVRVTLSEGEKGEAIEVVAIDLEKNEVVLNNSGVVTNVGLKTVKASAAIPGAPGAPGLLIPPGANPNAYVPSAGAAYPNAALPNANANRGGSVSAGALPIQNSAANPYANPNPAYSTPGFTPTTPTTGYNPNGNATANDFTKQIPSRNIRTQNAQPDVPVDPAVQYINMAVQKQQAERAGRPFPPLPPIPGLDPDHPR
jgi:hypothetical protein